MKLIAEIGINHDGIYEKALKLIEAAAESGSDGIKFQYRNLKRCYSSNEREEIGDQIIKSEIKRNYLSPIEIIKLSNNAKKINLKVGISFFNSQDIKDFEKYQLFDFYKIPSVELLNLDLIKSLLSTGKLVLISTGCHKESELEYCINSIKEYKNWMMLHCVSNYPLNLRNSKLGYIQRLEKLSERKVGYSSHDEDWENCLLAISNGAEIIERHITLDKDSRGLDHSTSSTPSEFKKLSKFLKEFPFIISGNNVRTLNQGELLNKQNLGRSLYSKKYYSEGQFVDKKELIELSPQTGITLIQFDKYINKPLVKALKKGEVIESSHFENACFLDEGTVKKAILNKLSLPVRVHDFSQINNFFNLKNYEFHLSYGEVLDGELNPKTYPIDCQYSIHLPDYIDSSTLIDPFSDNDVIKNQSLLIINKICNFAKGLQELSQNPVPIVGSFSVLKSDKTEFYENIKILTENCINKDCRLLPQWLPPIAWYFGGSVSLNVFCKSEDVKFLNDLSISICFDICHYLMCNSAKIVDKKDFDKLIRLAKHVHLADSIGIDGEGIQIGKGDLENQLYLEEVLKLQCPKVIEVWQGHLNSYKGFREGIINSIEKLKND